MNATTQLESQSIADAGDLPFDPDTAETLSDADALESAAIGQRSLKIVTDTLTEFDHVQAGLADMRQRYGNVVYDVSAATGMAEAKAARIAVREVRYAVDRTAKAAKEPLNALKRSIDSRGRFIKDEIVKLETPIHEQIKAEEDRKAAEKEEKARLERERAAKVSASIDDLKTAAMSAVGKSSSEIDLLREELAEIKPDVADFGDRTGEALQEQSRALQALDAMHAAAVTQEQAAAKAAAAEAELATFRAQQAERERVQTEEREAKEKVEREARAAELAIQTAAIQRDREALAAQQETLRLEREAMEADRVAAEKRRTDALEAERRETERRETERREAERLETERRETAEREERELAESQARAKREQAEREERERLDRVATEKRAEAARLAELEAARIETERAAEKTGRDAWKALLAAVRGLLAEADVTSPAYAAGVAAESLATGVKSSGVQS